MEEKDTLFSHVYNDLKLRILTGQITKGSTFPSIQRLREEYHIGFRTARDVTRKLKEDGLIDISPRKAPVVSVDVSMTPEYNTDAKIIADKAVILDVYNTIICILPALLTFAAQKCNYEYMTSYKQAVKTLHKEPGSDDWRTIFLLCREMFHACGNPLISDAFSSLAGYAYLPYLFNKKTSGINHTPGNMGQFLDGLSVKNPFEQIDILASSLEKIYLKIDKSIALLEEEHPDIKADSDETFKWNNSYSYVHNYQYAKIVSDLIIKITSGIYPPASYLPHEAVLADEYGVSVSTVRKALYDMRDLGYCMTLNAKGTVVLKRDDDYNMPLGTIHNPNYKLNALQYLYAIQFMSLIIYPSANKAFDLFTASDRDIILTDLTDDNPDLIKSIMNVIVERMPLESLRTILMETNKIIYQSYYSAFGSSKKVILEMKNHNSEIRRALLNNDKKGFITGLAAYYDRLLAVAHDYFTEKRMLNEAASIVNPSWH